MSINAEQIIEAYPLHWPVGYSRTSDVYRTGSRFKNTLGSARDLLKEEVRRLGGQNLIISTNIPTKSNGDLYADWSRYKIEDPGVAIYFKYNNKDVALCCDKYVRVWENLQALGKAIEAIRGLERWGVSDFLERAFTGFQQLPESTMAEKNIWDVLGLTGKPEHVEKVHAAYRSRAKCVHPDVGGSAESFSELRNAYKSALNFYQQ